MPFGIGVVTTLTPVFTTHTPTWLSLPHLRCHLCHKQLFSLSLRMLYSLPNTCVCVHVCVMCAVCVWEGCYVCGVQMCMCMSTKNLHRFAKQNRTQQGDEGELAKK